MLLNLDKSRLKLLDPFVFDLALLAQTVDDLIESLDVLLVLYLLLTNDTQLLDLASGTHLACTGAKVAHETAWFGPTLAHTVGPCVLNWHRVCKDSDLGFAVVQLSMLAS